MGTSRTAAELAATLRDLGTATQRRMGEVVNEGGLATKTIMLSAASARGVSPGSKIAGKKWNVRYDVRPGLNPTALVRFTGPFHLVNNPTGPHHIAAKRLGRSSTRRGRQGRAERGGRGVFGGFGDRIGAKSLRFGGSNFAYVNHPGTPGKQIFQAGRAIAVQRVPRVMAARQVSIWSGVLR